MAEGSTETRQALQDGRRAVDAQRRFDLVIVLNDLAIGLWFAVGCVLFLADTTTAAIWMFLFGSLQMIAGPLLRLWRHRRLSAADVERSDER